MLRGLRRNDVVVPVKIESPLTLSVAGKERLGNLLGAFLRNVWRQPFTIQTGLPYAALEEIHAKAIILSRRILRSDGDKLLQQRRHLVLVLP